MNSSDPSLQRQFTPLNTWINAKTNRHQAGALEQPVSAIREMVQQYWTENNLGRYSLLTTYLLQDAGDSLQSDEDRKNVLYGKIVSVLVDLVGPRCFQ